MNYKNLKSHQILEVIKDQNELNPEQYAQYISAQSKDLIVLVISFRQNKIGGQGASLFAQQISQCLNLSQLNIDFSGNQIKENGLIDLCNSIGNCLNISSLQLDLSRNMIADDGFQQKPKKFRLIHLNNLIIQLSCNKIGDKGISFLTKTIAQCENVDKLDINLKQNNISVWGTLLLGDGIAKCKDLTCLKLNFDILEMKSQTNKDFFSCLEASKINELSFGFHINSQISKELMNGLTQIKSLSHLELNFDQIQDEESKTIAKKIGKLVNLRFLELSFDYKISAECVANVFSRLKNCINLLDLQIFAGCEHISLFKLNNFLCYLTSLKRLVLSFYDNNSFIGDISHLSKGIACCENLESLEIDMNELSDEDISLLGEGIGQCSKLSNLKLEITGTTIGIDTFGMQNLGRGLGKCSNLKKIDINFEHNQILDQVIFCFLEELSKAALLEFIKLNLGKNIVCVDNPSSIGQGLSLFQNLKTLDININDTDIDNDGAYQLGQSLMSCQNVTTFRYNISCCQNLDNEEGLQNFENQIKKMKRLVNHVHYSFYD